MDLDNRVAAVREVAHRAVDAAIDARDLVVGKICQALKKDFTSNSSWDLVCGDVDRDIGGAGDADAELPPLATLAKSFV